MATFTQNLFVFFVAVAFLATILLNLTKRNSSLVWLYALQSVLVTGIIFTFAMEAGSIGLMVVALFTFLVKVVVAPWFFFRLISRHHLTFSGTTYLNTPLTFLAVALVSSVSYSSVFRELTQLIPQASLNLQKEQLVLTTVAIILSSLLFIVNRKGALSQIVGVLSLENGVVAFSSLIGLEHTFGLELSIVFDLLVWLIIATVFLSLLWRTFGTLDVSVLRRLKE